MIPHYPFSLHLAFSIFDGGIQVRLILSVHSTMKLLSCTAVVTLFLSSFVSAAVGEEEPVSFAVGVLNTV